MLKTDALNPVMSQKKETNLSCIGSLLLSQNDQDEEEEGATGRLIRVEGSTVEWVYDMSNSAYSF